MNNSFFSLKLQWLIVQLKIHGTSIPFVLHHTFRTFGHRSRCGDQINPSSDASDFFRINRASGLTYGRDLFIREELPSIILILHLFLLHTSCASGVKLSGLMAYRTYSSPEIGGPRNITMRLALAQRTLEFQKIRRNVRNDRESAHSLSNQQMRFEPLILLRDRSLVHLFTRGPLFLINRYNQLNGSFSSRIDLAKYSRECTQDVGNRTEIPNQMHWSC